MPLVKSASKKARQENIRREIDAGKDPRQAVAIGYAVQRRASAKRGHKEHMSREHVSKWTRGERKDYR